MRFYYFHILLKLSCNACFQKRSTIRYHYYGDDDYTGGAGEGGGGVMVNFTLRPGETTFAA